MSGKLPVLTGDAVVRALKRVGFHVVRVRGSHHILRNAESATTVVPIHAGETIGPGLLGKILRDANLTREAFRELLD